MNDLPLLIYDSHAVQTLDKLITEQGRVSAYQLMCRAGQAALNLLIQNWPETSSLAICCGTGNNGGDGLVLARLAKTQNMTVFVYQIGKINEEKYSIAAKQAREDWLSIGGEILEFQGEKVNP